jgi:hypothetical protein
MMKDTLLYISVGALFVFLFYKIFEGLLGG